MLAELSIFPTDRGESGGQYVDEVVKYIKSECGRKGIVYYTNSMSTLIEGESKDVWEVLISCHNIMRGSSNRYYSVIKIDERKNMKDSIVGKKAKIERILGH